jgi:ABC-2 type transport system ATP-binding protein
MSDALISVSSLTKRFGDHVVLKDFSLVLDRGKCIGVLGINGSGKTTLLKILLNLVGFDGGTFEIARQVFVAGRRGGKLPPAVSRLIGYVSQQAAFDEEMTAWQSLQFYGQLFHIPNNLLTERIGSTLSLVQLLKAGDMQVNQLSGGMKRRLAIARALVVKPSMLFLDEPTANLDPISRNQIWDLIDVLKKDQGISVLLSTNDMVEAQRLCDTIYLLKDGACAVHGNPDDLVSSLNVHIVELCFSRAGMEHQVEVKEMIAGSAPDAVFKSEGYMHVRVFIPAASSSDEQLIQQARKTNGWFETISVRKPTLEDFFMKTAGVSFETSDLITYRSLQAMFDRFLGRP